MLRHVVLLRFRSDVTPEEKAALMAPPAGLRRRLPLTNIGIEPKLTHGFHDGFVIDLADAAARDAYLADPEHRAVGARLAAACEGGRAGLVVVDHAV